MLQLSTAQLAFQIRFLPLTALQKRSPSNDSYFQRIAHSFRSVLMMSYSNDETLHNIKQAIFSKVRFADEAGPSKAL